MITLTINPAERAISKGSMRDERMRFVAVPEIPEVDSAKEECAGPKIASNGPKSSGIGVPYKLC